MPAVNANLVTFLTNVAVGVKCGERAVPDGAWEPRLGLCRPLGEPAMSLNR